MTEQIKEASRLRADGRVELTGHTDEDGILVEPTAYDAERMGREAYLAYQEKRRQQMADKKVKAAEEERFAQFEATYTAHGGTKADARAAYRAMKSQQAAEAAQRSDEEARHAHATTMRAAV